MIIWSRLGFLVPLIWVLLAVLANVINLKSYVSKPLDASVILILAGLIYWFLGRKINANTVHEVIDKKSGETITINNIHTFFFIRIEYWSVIAIAFAIFIYLKH